MPLNSTRRHRAAALFTALLAGVLLVGCTPPPPNPEHAAAIDLLEDVVALQMETPTRFDDLDYKTPAGVALYTSGTDIAQDGEETRADYRVVVVNLSDGAVFVQRGGLQDTEGMEQFESVAAYTDWAAHQFGVLPDITGVVAAYGRQVVIAQQLHYAELGRFAPRDELIEYSTLVDNRAPDLTPVVGADLALEADAYGYIALNRSAVDSRLGLTYGYEFASSEGVPATVRIESVDELHDEGWAGLEPPGIDGNPGLPFEFVAVEPADANESGFVPAVPFPTFG